MDLLYGSPTRSSQLRARYEALQARRQEPEPEVPAPGGLASRVSRAVGGAVAPRASGSGSAMPSMEELGMVNVRQVAMDGAITVAQLTFLKRLFHQTQEASRSTQSGQPGSELAGLDRDHFVNIFTQAFDKGTTEIERLFDKLDANADGQVTCDEFLTYMVDKNTRLLKTEETACLYPAARSSVNTLEYGPIDRIISIPGKRLFAAVEGQRNVLLFSMETLELVHTIPTPTFPSHGSTPLTDPEFMDYPTADASLSSDSPPLAQATSRIVDVVYWEDGTSRFLVTLTDNSMFTPFLTVLDVQRAYREVACVPLPDTRTPTCMTVMTDPHGKSYFLIGQRDGGCASYDAPSARDLAQSKANRMETPPPAKLHQLKRKMHGEGLPDRTHCVTRIKVLPVLGRTKVVSTGLDGVLSVANLENWSGATSAQRCQTQRQGLNSFAYSARHSCFVTGGIDRTVRLWNADSCGMIETLSGHKASVVDVVVNDDLHQIVSASADHVVKVWDVRTYKCLQTISTVNSSGATREELTALHYDAQSRTVVTAGAGVLATWSVEATPGSVVGKRDGEDDMTSRAASSIVRALHCSVFQQLVTVFSNGVAIVSDMNTEQPVIRFGTGHSTLVTAACLDARERRLITGSHGGSVHVHNFNNAALLHKFSPRSAEISELVALPRVTSSSSFSVVASCWDNKVCLWPDKEQNQAGVDVMELSAHKTDVTCVVQYGQFLASASADGMLMIWHSRSVDFNFARLPKFKYLVPGSEGSRGRPSVTKLLHLPQQNKLLVCIQDGWMHLYSAQGQGLPKACVASAGDGVAAIALAPAGSEEESSIVATGDYRGRVMFWAVSGTGDRTTLTEQGSWQHPSGAAITSISFSAPPAEHAADFNVAPRVICGDGEGGTALLRPDATLDHFFGHAVPEPAPPASVTVEVERSESVASVRPADPE
jgi:WD40 repeat protein